MTGKQPYHSYVLIIPSLILCLFLVTCSTTRGNSQLENMSVQFVEALFEDNQDAIKELTIEGKSFGILLVGQGNDPEIANIIQKELIQEGDKYKNVLEVNFKDEDTSPIMYTIIFSQVDGKWKISDYKPAPVTNGETQDPNNLEEAVSFAIKGQRNSYGHGETATEGHIILETEEQNDTVKVYAIASYGAFGFENDIFTKVSGSGAIPTVITFSKGNNGEYFLLDYEEPLDGGGFTDSVKKMFPRKMHSRVLVGHEDYPTLAKQQEAQAEEYLKSIGRTAPVSAGHVEKQLAELDVEASNKLFSELTKYDTFLNSCPYWLGTREEVENGTRYIYETAQSKSSDGYDLMIFTKKKEDGTIVEEQQYKIVGSEPQLME